MEHSVNYADDETNPNLHDKTKAAGASRQRLNEIKEKMGSLERVLEQDVARQHGKPSSSTSTRAERRTSADLPGGETSSSDNEGAVPEDEKGLEATPLAVIDAAYEDDANDDILDLGVRLGATLAKSKRDSNLNNVTSAVPKLPDSDQDFLAPGSSYIAPGSGFLFGDVGSKRSLINFLPTKGAADVLVRHYSECAHHITRVVHWPSFVLHYDNFWTSVLAGLEPPAWQQALVLSILFASVASMDEKDVEAIFARPKSPILRNFQTGTEVTLSKAQFLRATKLETLQALVIYLLPMCRDQMSRAHSVLVGMAIRLAECMGLHRDPETLYGLSPVECHARRILWFELCFLDFRTCESQGPRPGIKREDYDTRFPLNINDADLFQPNIRDSKTSFTDMTTSRIRFECTEMQRVIWQDRIRLERKKVSLTHVLSKIETFRKAMEAKYTPMLNLKVPIQRYAQLVMSLMIQRMYVMVMHRFLNHAPNLVPERLLNLTVSGGVQSMEAAIALQSLPELSQWRWYGGAYQQWHIAFLLLTIDYQMPNHAEADRIWNILDFVFEPDQSSSRTQKAQTIIEAIKDRTGVYRDLRKIRIPPSMKDGLEMVDSNVRKPTNDPSASTEVGINSSTLQGEVPPAASMREQNWSFENPATLYVTSLYDGRSEQSGWNSSTSHGPGSGQTQSARPIQPPQQGPQHISPRSDSQSHPSPGHLGEFHSPSDSSTNESWPPLITSDQMQWRTVLNNTGSGIQLSAPTHGLAPMSSPPQPAPGSIGNMFMNSGFQSDQVNIPQYPVSVNRGDSMMADINWTEWDQLFPPESNNDLLDHTVGYDTGPAPDYKPYG
ncbi:hypothetical protein B0A52_03610 [Exophiala mesophila]|uniref:Xylanolytic transcriptional activator regulatory domain-containing protein n=1 Tax=Exophiala mesophila TaxID=212818 RepID=A0A438N9H5_EXOME|nr:hypothetical protein B0A52_03610 [Exophiala mesophila]